jgi:hypothetical protein
MDFLAEFLLFKVKSFLGPEQLRDENADDRYEPENDNTIEFVEFHAAVWE